MKLKRADSPQKLGWAAEQRHGPDRHTPGLTSTRLALQLHLDRGDFERPGSFGHHAKPDHEPVFLARNRSDAAPGDRSQLGSNQPRSRAGDPWRINLWSLATRDHTDTQLEALADQVWSGSNLGTDCKRLRTLTGSGTNEYNFRQESQPPESNEK
jgi:hypothetical protein